MNESKTLHLRKSEEIKKSDATKQKQLFISKYKNEIQSLPDNCDGCLVYGITKLGRRQPLAYIKGSGNLSHSMLRSTIQLDFYPFPLAYAIYALLNRGSFKEIQLRTINY
jgi:hypothetical protein